MAYDPRHTTKAFAAMLARQGGGLLFYRNDDAYPDTSETYTVATSIPAGYKPFDISIYNAEADVAEATLRLIVNPTDIQIGQVFLANTVYTRGGWVSTLWGRQQGTINANGITPACYTSSSGFTRPVNSAGMLTGTTAGGPLNEGLVNFKRRDSLSFINYQTLVAFFKNNAGYVLTDPKEKTMYGDRTRVINVMDMVMISYDGTEYIGSFSTFTSDETGDKPYSMSYTFEYIISGLRGMLVEGHVHKGDNIENSSVELAVQGSDTTLVQALYMDSNQLTKNFGINQEQLDRYESDGKTYQYALREASDEAKNNDGFRKLDPNTVVVTSTGVGPKGEDREDHTGKIDDRTASGKILSLAPGEVVQVKKEPDHYIVIKSNIGNDASGNPVYRYIRYYHIDPDSMAVKEGDKINQGDYIGSEHKKVEQVNVGGQIHTYTPHCDIEMRNINGDYKKGTWQTSGTREDVSGVFINAIATWHANAVGDPTKNIPPDTKYSDYTTLQYRNSKQVIKTNDPKVQALYTDRTNIVNP